MFVHHPKSLVSILRTPDIIAQPYSLVQFLPNILNPAQISQNFSGGLGSGLVHQRWESTRVPAKQQGIQSCDLHPKNHSSIALRGSLGLYAVCHPSLNDPPWKTLEWPGDWNWRSNWMVNLLLVNQQSLHLWDILPSLYIEFPFCKTTTNKIIFSCGKI